MNTRQQYVPALGFHALTRFYDPLIRWFLRETTFKRALIEQAQIAAGHRVLDVGCGTGTLTLMARQASPGAEIVGIDGDPNILTIARRKPGIPFDSMKHSLRRCHTLTPHSNASSAALCCITSPEATKNARSQRFCAS